jgi:hypothetical protein
LRDGAIGPTLPHMSDESKKAEDVLRQMRAELEKAAVKIRDAGRKAIDAPESKELIARADKLLAKLGRGADVLIHELEDDLKDLKTKLKEATKDPAPAAPPTDGDGDGNGNAPPTP